MKKLTLSFLAIFICLSLSGQNNSFYELAAKTIDGENFDFAQLSGKKVMIVNTATKCSLSPQFKSMQKLHEKYGSDQLVILAFPNNGFANREPGTNESIKQTCAKRYGLSLTLMEKVEVYGRNIHPVYAWLTQKKLNGVRDAEIKWNFQKFLIDEKGHLYDIIDPMKKPDGEPVIKWIENQSTN